MGYDSLAPTEENLQDKLAQVSRLQKQLQACMKTIGNLDERLAQIEAMSNAALLKQQDDIAGLVADINELKGNTEYKSAANKFDMEGVPAPHPDDAPVPPPII